MNLFGFGNISGVYNFLKNKLFEVKKKEEEEELFFEEAITASSVTDSGIAQFSSKEIQEEQVLYIRWPLRASMFMNIKEGSDIELRKKDMWSPDEVDKVDVPSDEADVLKVPDIVNVPILKPVMQDESIGHIDILTSRGIFIGLSPIDYDWLVETADEELLKQEKTPETKIKSNEAKNKSKEDTKAHA